AKAGTPYNGILYAGLMLTDDGPKLIEYNVRFGDPECQVLMMRLESDLLELMYCVARGRLASADPPLFSDSTALSVVMAARGYPGQAETGGPIGGLDGLSSDEVRVFQAGTALRDGRLVATGGRVLNVTALGSTISEARDKAYEAVGRIDFPSGFCRTDIGWREIARSAG
ncbi:MAG TPA: phosphoribosylglycinamide synthetase C domain-containing protein, partial [Allosphingosinicella sp.]|nr:phosphoribosylglycinamide synthetase C domain-containing protein [Allosphingosinicella sp.]